MALDNKTLQLRELLSKTSLFKDSASHILDGIVPSLESQTFTEGDVIFSKGDRMQALYIIDYGRVKAHDGDHLFAEFRPHEFFGEYSLIDDSIRSATVTALEPTRVVILYKENFDRLIERNPRVARAVMETLINRLRSCNVLEEQLTKKSQDLKREKEQIEKQREDLKNLNATKDKFFSLIAHDLKNPFNTIIGLSELVLQRFDSYSGKRIKEFVRQIYSYSTHTYTLLDNMLQWARSQTGQIKVHPEQVELDIVIRENINLLQNKAEEKHIKLETDIHQDACQVFGDENMISTVMRNLISNAIKFTSEDGVVLIRSRLKDREHVELSVFDNGIGIPQENLSKIFALDAGYTTQGTRGEKGTGLGLLLCKEFVQMNGGEISVESEVNQGSTFYVLLPVHSNTQEQNKSS